MLGHTKENNLQITKKISNRFDFKRYRQHAKKLEGTVLDLRNPNNSLT